MYKSVITLLLVAIACNVNSQTVYEDFTDGRVYFQVSQEFYETNSVEEAHELLLTNLNGYKVRELTTPFSNTANSDELKRIYRLKFTEFSQVDNVLRDLSALEQVVFAEKAPLARLSLFPNDPYYTNGELWYLDKIQAPKAWDITKGSSDIVIAIVDNAIQIEHPDLIDNLWNNPGEIAGNGKDDDGNGAVDDIRGWDVSDNDDYTSPPTLIPAWSHGTQTSGLASAATDNNEGIASIGYNLSICPVKIESNSSNNPTLATDSYEGLNYALNTPAVDIINMSWGFFSISQTNNLLLTEAYNRGKILVAGAGNNNANVQFYPAMHSKTIAVAGTDSLDKKSSFSNYASWVDISAPASDIISSVLTVLDPPYFVSGGTSFATPITAGTIGLMKSIKPDLTQDEALNCITSTADPIDHLNPGYSGLLGSGRLNAWKALQCTQQLVSSEDYKPGTMLVEVFPNPVTDNLTLKTVPLHYQLTTFYVYDLSGRLVLASTTTKKPIDVSHLEKGVYLFQVFHEKKMIGTGKFIKN